MQKNNDLDIYRIVKTLKNGQRTIVYSTLLSFLISFAYIFISTPQYESYISINPIGDNMNSLSSSIGGLQGLASEYGVNLNVGDLINEKPSFYIPDIVNSRALKKAVIRNKWKTINYESIDLIKYWEIDDTVKFSIGKVIETIKGRDPYIDLNSKFMDNAIEKLSEQIFVEEEESGLIKISVMMEEPKLSSDISNYIANYIKEYISDVMLSYSSTHREFIEERLMYSKKELSKSEEDLKEFSEKNPFAVDTPELQLQRGRLMRNMEVNQQVYITLRQQYEMARINELKETPVINILDLAEPPSEKSKPRSIFILFISLLTGFSLAAFFLILKNELKIKD